MPSSNIKLLEHWLYGKPSDTNEQKLYCPLHEDPANSKSPSSSINLDTEQWHCQSCAQGGTLRKLIRGLRASGKLGANGEPTTTKKTQEKPSSPRRGASKDRPLPDETQIEYFCRQLLAESTILKRFQDKRGLSLDTIRRYKIGWDGERFTIPIYDGKELVNVRRYRMNAPGPSKMLSWGPGHGEARLYSPEDIKDHDDVLLTEGELDKVIAKQHKLPAVTHTGGAGVWKPAWSPMFKGKRVYVAYDEDDAGDKGAMKVAQNLKNIAAGVYRVRLETGIKSGDITDYFVTCGGSAEDLWEKINNATAIWETRAIRKVPTKGRKVTVEESQNVQYKEPIEMTATVIGKQVPAFVIPKKLDVVCGQNAGPQCNACPLAVFGGKTTIELNPDDERMLAFINASDRRKNELLSQMTGARCVKHVEYTAVEEYNVEELYVAPSVEHRTEETETPIHRRVMAVGTYSTKANSQIRVVGKQAPDPNSQRGLLMGWHVEQVAPDLDRFTMDDEKFSRLQAFQPEKGQTPYEKMLEISKDLSANVTKIYGRDIMHMAMDLVYHSVINFEFSGKEIKKGWLEALILGDTRTGKSETVNSLRNHYGAGVMRSCESSSFAGLVGGAQQLNGGAGWIVTWGTIPMNDRRLVVLDEMSGLTAKDDILGLMSSIRSEGRAEVTKIADGETSARTRLIWLSNPTGGRRLSDSHGSALEALGRLVKNPEDIARFDFAMSVANDEVDSSLINSTDHQEVEHMFNADLCHEMLMWAWSRKYAQVRWGAGAEQAVLEMAERMGNAFVPTPPLVQAENIRMKIARVAVAFAARTFSTRDGETLLVQKTHVQSAAKFLGEIYSTPSMDYLGFSNKIHADRKMAEESKDKVRKYLRSTPEIMGSVRAIGSGAFRPRDFEESAAMERSEANTVVRKLMEWKMIVRMGRGELRFEKAMMDIMREIDIENFTKG